MKKNLLLLMSILLTVLTCLVSCDKNLPEEEPGNDIPADSVVVLDTTASGLPMFNFPKVNSVPITAGNLLAEGSDIGVTIEVTKVEHQNFVFELRPGAMIQSFRFDVFPVSQLYNTLLNDNMVGKDEVDINEQIRKYIFAEDGTGGFQISVKDFASPEDFLQIEYDWMNTTYAAATAIAIPNCDYIIAVVACTEDNCSSSSQGELTLCYVHTTSEELIGDPQVEIDVNVGYTAFGVNHIPNADAAGVYFFGYLTSEIDDYIDTFGDRMFRDFMRTRTSSPQDASDPDALVYSVSYGEAADHRIQSTTCAVAVDANLTPAATYSRKDFHLLEIPKEQPEAFVSVEIPEARIAASYFEFDIKFSKDCQTFFMRIYNEEEKAALEASAENRKAEARDMVANGGWGCHNPNFKWDAAKGESIGASATVSDVYYGGLKPGETYYMGFVGRNAYQTLTDLSFSAPIKLDSRNLTSNENCNVKDLRVEINNIQRTQYTVDIYYDPATVSMVYVSYFFEGAEGFTLTKDSSWKEWVDYIFAHSQSGTESQEYSNTNVNAWPTLPNGHDYWGVTGMTPGTEYTVFVCAEDFDGNISDVIIKSVTTKIPTPGPDPTMDIKLTKANNSMGEWMITYSMVKDVKEFYYAYVDNYSELATALPGISKYHWDNIGKSSFTYDMWNNGLYTWCAGGITNNGGGMHTDAESTPQYFNGSNQVIAVCIAVGEKDGAPVYKMYHLICKNGQTSTLEEKFSIK